MAKSCASCRHAGPYLAGAVPQQRTCRIRAPKVLLMPTGGLSTYFPCVLDTWCCSEYQAIPLLQRLLARAA